MFSSKKRSPSTRRKGIPLRVILVILWGFTACVLMGIIILRESRFRETVLANRYESTTTNYKGFEAYLLKGAIDAYQERRRTDKGLWRDLEEQLEALSRKPPIADNEPFWSESETLMAIKQCQQEKKKDKPSSDIGINFCYHIGNKNIADMKMRCRVSLFIPSYLTMDGTLSRELQERVELSEKLERPLCRLIFEHQELGVRQARYVSRFGWYRLVSKEMTPASVEWEDPNANFADNANFKEAWKTPNKVVTSPPFVDARQSRIAVRDVVSIDWKGKNDEQGMVTADIELLPAKEYLNEVQIGSVPGFGTLKAAFVKCKGGRELTDDKKAFCNSVSQNSLGQTTLAGSTVFTIPLKDHEYAYLDVDPNRPALIQGFIVILIGLILLPFGLLAYMLRRFYRDWLAEVDVQEKIDTAMPGGLAFLDRNLCVVRANKTLCHMVGRTTLEGLHFRDDLLDVTSHTEFSLKATSKERFELIVALEAKGGPLVPAIVTGTPMRYRESPGYMVVVLPMANLGPVVASRFINDFSHNLKTPVHSLVGLSHEIGKENLPVQKARTYRKLIKEEANRFSSMVTNLIAFASLDLGFEAGRELVELKNLLKPLTKSIRNRAAAKGISVVETVPVGEHIRVAKVAFEIILTNLLENALKYSKQGRIDLRINTLDDKTPRCLSIEVADQGIGIPPEDRGLIFERFKRGTSRPVQKEEGVGLGLYLVKKQVRLLGGTVTLDEERQVGTKFIICIPMAADAPAWSY